MPAPGLEWNLFAYSLLLVLTAFLSLDPFPSRLSDAY